VNENSVVNKIVFIDHGQVLQSKMSSFEGQSLRYDGLRVKTKPSVECNSPGQQ